VKTLKELKTEYELFIRSIPELLSQVEENILNTKISFSLNEIEKAQKYYEENHLRPGIDLENLKKYFYAYAGEAFIKYFGGNWELSTLKKDEAYGTPTIVNWGPDDYLGPSTGKYPWSSISPFVWTEIIRKRGKMERTIRQIFESNINRFKVK
jgi:hypothetical protein